MGSTAHELEKWARKNNVNSFLGVFPADELPPATTIAIPAAFVVNYDPARLPGSHWVSCMISRDYVTWFDSYGLAPDADDIILGHKTYFRKWLSAVCRRLGLKNYDWNKFDLQAMRGITCGHYALWFLKNGPKKGWEMFGSDLEANDRLIQRLVVL